MQQVSRRSFAGTLAAPLCSAAKSAVRPNIILILTDDQRYDAFSASGYRRIFRFLKTPNMDRLAAEGVHFRNAFCTTSLCSPSRASILSGQFMRTHGVNALEKDFVEKTRIFPQILREAGYETGFVGKWHLGRESDVPDPAFDRWAGLRGQGTYFDPVLNIDGSRRQIGGYVTDILTDHAIEFVNRKRGKPFFLQLSHKAPHGPCTPPKHLERLFDRVRIDYPSSYLENHSDKPAWYLNYHGHDAFHEKFHPHAKFEEEVRNYGRCLASVDQNLGRLLDALDTSGQAGNTAVIYLSDNGHFMAEHQLYSKMIMYEEAIRIPLLVRYPALAARGVRRDEFVLNIDVAPAILDLAGVQPSPEMEGRSFKRLMENKSAPDWRRSFLYEYEDDAPSWGLPQLEGVRTADGWQYTRYPDWEQMYCIQDDPQQVRNLAKDPRYAGKKRELIAELGRLGGGAAALKGAGEYKRKSEPVHTPHPPASVPSMSREQIRTWSK